MNSNTVRWLWIAAAAMCALPCPAEPLLIDLPPVPASAAGMGMGSVALPISAGTIFWNPAGTAATNLQVTEFNLAVAKLEVPGNWSFYVANASPHDDRHFGLAVIREHILIDSTDHGRFQVIMPMSACLLGKSLPVGVGVKFISERDGSANWRYGAALDGGAMWQSGGFTVGFASHNVAASNLADFTRRSWLGASFGGQTSTVVVTGQVEMVHGLSWKRAMDNHQAGVRLRFGGGMPELWLGRIAVAEHWWTTMGLGYYARRANSRLSYSVVFRPNHAGDRIHYLTYSFATPTSGG